MRWSRTVCRCSYSLQKYQYPTFRRAINKLVKSSVLVLVLHFVRLKIHWSGAECCLSYFLLTIDALVKTKVSLVLPFVGLSIQLSRAVCCYSYILQDYQYSCQEQCKTIYTFVNSTVSLVLMAVRRSVRWVKALCRKSKYSFFNFYCCHCEWEYINWRPLKSLYFSWVLVLIEAKHLIKLNQNT